jgi:hypothetical protein
VIRIMLALALAGTPGSDYQLPSMRETPTNVVVPPMVAVPSAPQVDRRPMVIGAGILIVAGVSWWSSRRRARESPADAGRAALPKAVRSTIESEDDDER